jgi:Ca2+-binding RTX toxin-like protein
VVDVFDHSNVFDHNNLGIAYGVNVKNALIGSGNDTVTGNDVGDNITLGSGNDSVANGSGADTVSVGTGTDVIDGGAGTDVAVFAGNLSQYTFTYTGNGTDILVTGPDGNKTLRNVETAQFADVTVAIPTGLTIGGTPGTAAGPGAPSVLYVPSDALLTSAIARVKSVIADLGNQQAQLGSRIEFNDAKVQVLNGGVDKLTLADLNDEGAAFAALQTRQQMATVALSIVSKQSKGLLQMFA